MPRRWKILAVLCLSLFVVVLDNTVLNVAVPSLMHDLPASVAATQWIVDAYSLVFAGLLLTAGSWADRRGRRRALLYGFALFGLGSLGAALARDAGTLIALRGLMGAGGALVMPSTLSIIAQVFDEEERPKAMGIWGATGMLGLALGPTLGGLLIQRFGWDSVFLINVPVAAVAVVAALAVVPESSDPRPGEHADVPGAVLSGLGIAALVWTVISIPGHGVTSPVVLGGLAVAVTALAGFAVRERRAAHPMLDLALFGRPGFSAATVVIALLALALSGLTFVLTQYLQLVLGYSAMRAGLALVPAAVLAAIGNGLGGALAGRIGSNRTAALGLSLTAGGFALMASTSQGSGYPHLLAVMVPLCLGLGVTGPAAYEALLGAVPRSQAGVAAALNDAVQEVGTTLGVAVLGSVVSAVYAASLPSGAPAGARESLAGALRLGLGDTARAAFVHAVDAGSWAAAGILVATAALALARLGRHTSSGAVPTAPEPAAAHG
ncbi:MFS transporter [Streptosporangium pseudovulgare]|uniref:MFS transporter n=1 Tax=Streptosporangium pseudovulgare TaxID=35765 RepID=A0ABQ2QGP2_9ACTN|nr:MFS transporter [Streptosporangium pseudovulgare]GGP81102.1 MFS transporter [Streptosporangium pseudovulgare]